MRLFLFIYLSISCVIPAISSEIAGGLTPKGITWQSAQNTSDGLAPAIWDVPLSLPAADKVILSGASVSDFTLKLSGPEGMVSVPVNIKGMSYKLSSNVGMMDIAGSSTIISGTSAFVSGGGTGNKIVTLSSLSSPFTHFRPILNANNISEWPAKFKAAGLSKGKYQGQINYLVPYNYYRNDILIRYTLQGSLSVSVLYNPAQLNSVEVIGDGIIMPQYYGYPERLVGGSTDYTINATGVFPNGINMGLRASSSHNNRYQLLSQSPTSLPTSIDYSVRCTVGCEGDNKIITNGVPDINSTNRHVKISASNTTSARAIITVSFANKKLTELNNDAYLGNFILIFEAGV